MSRKHRIRIYTKIVYYSPEELAVLKQKFAESNCTTLTGYIRSVSLQTPITVTYRNKSFDAFVEEATKLRNEMQLVWTKTTLAPADAVKIMFLHAEIKSAINHLVDQCRHI